MRGKKAKAKAKAKAAAQPKMTAAEKAKSKAAAKPKNKSAAKAKAAALPTTSAVAGAPAMPPLKKVPVIVWGTCNIYSSAADQKRRVTTAENRRYDKTFSWKANPKDAWARLLEYCASKQ